MPWVIAADSNRHGLGDVMPGWASDYAAAEAAGLRSRIFLTRAMRTALAIWLWRIDHAGTLPATLEELTPDYLPEAQRDPWTGGPLRWDPASETLSGAGSGWVHGAAPGLIEPGEIKTLETVPCVRLPDFPAASP